MIVRRVAQGSTSWVRIIGRPWPPEEPRAEAAPREPTHRLFFALWPDEAMRQSIAQATRKAGSLLFSLFVPGVLGRREAGFSDDPSSIGSEEDPRGLPEGTLLPCFKPFRPHVTVVRKVSRAGRIEKMQPIVWSFTELAPVESRTLRAGAPYSVVGSYPLCAGKPANNSETA